MKTKINSGVRKLKGKGYIVLFPQLQEEMLTESDFEAMYVKKQQKVKLLQAK